MGVGANLPVSQILAAWNPATSLGRPETAIALIPPHLSFDTRYDVVPRTGELKRAARTNATVS